MRRVKRTLRRVWLPLWFEAILLATDALEETR